jgi:hypothetical protein
LTIQWCYLPPWRWLFSAASSPPEFSIFSNAQISGTMGPSTPRLPEHNKKAATMSEVISTTERDGTFLKALDRCNAATHAACTRFSNYATYRVALQEASARVDPCPCSWHDASEMCALLSGAALEWCGSLHHRGATVKLFSQVGVSYWASKFAIEHLSQFETYL